MIYVGVCYWLILGVLSFIEMDIKLLGLIYFIGAGMIFPMGIMVSKLLKMDLMANDNPLAPIGGVLGGMQILFSPVLILIYVEHIQWLPFFIAVLTGAHFLPFATIYKSKAYIFQSIAVIVVTSIIGLIAMEKIHVILPFVLSAIYFCTCLLLIGENRKVKNSDSMNMIKSKNV